MSDSPDDTYDKLPDELEEGAQLAGNSDTGAASTPAKRGRGRPKGSKNKKNAAGTAASTSEVAPAAGEKRKRGRPPKPKNVPEEGASGEPPAKRKRGRPPKNPKPTSPPHEDVGEGGTSDSPTKRKRGRPPKNAA
ncbi:hypothetical protein DFH94DRAFT_751101 [Russula ochroleuca]|uniref:Uncharacterized protein n=1 Tax=Russula ochroleuca TaxID=152965 RepID=A0A9P5MTY2_9AGAM|nr:hypothetical protein DFH94DRAFT_751101 [Russula ochroleuca]